jgi:dimethylargininase
MFTHAITRKPGADFAQGITTSDLGKPDYALILAQHKAYVDALRALRLDVVELEPLPGYPDAYFVEDVAVVTPDVAVMTHPGADARKGEGKTIEPVLAQYRPIERILAPGTVDGGDVLIVDGQAFIGVSERTNETGARQLGTILERYGCTWTMVPVGAGLHLKSDVNVLGPATLLVTESFANHDAFAKFERIVVDAAEAYAANTLWVNGTLITPRGFPKTRNKLDTLGLDIVDLDVSEMRKMDGGLTCLSLRF